MDACWERGCIYIFWNVFTCFGIGKPWAVAISWSSKSWAPSTEVFCEFFSSFQSIVHKYLLPFTILPQYFSLVYLFLLLAIFPCWWEWAEENLLGEESRPAVTSICSFSLHSDHRHSHQNFCPDADSSGWDIYAVGKVEWSDLPCS